MKGTARGFCTSKPLGGNRAVKCHHSRRAWPEIYITCVSTKLLQIKICLRTVFTYFSALFQVFTMFILILLIAVALHGMESEGRLCGSPPVCRCHLAVRLMDCHDVEEMPKFGMLAKKQYRMLHLARRLSTAPDLTQWTSLAWVDVEGSRLSCATIEAWRRRVQYKVRATRCANATGMYRILLYL